MKRTTNKGVVEAFFNHQSAKSNNMRTDGVRLYSYATCMMEWNNGILYVNTTKYSVTTSHQMCHAKVKAELYAYCLVSGAPQSKAGLYSIFQFYRDTNKDMRPTRQRERNFRMFKTKVKNFLDSNLSNQLSDKNREILKAEYEACRANKYRKFQHKFAMITSQLQEYTYDEILRRRSREAASRKFAFC